MKWKIYSTTLLFLVATNVCNQANATSGSWTADPFTEAPTANKIPPVNCSLVDCTSANQRMIGGNRLFDETNFDPIVDDFGRVRKFWVHIPDEYDLDGPHSEEIPTIFAFHGLGQTPEKMVDGKWEEYFDNGIAFVIPKGEPNPCANHPAFTSWMVPMYILTVTPDDPNCEPPEYPGGAYPNNDDLSDFISYGVNFWDASMSSSFTDVRFVEALHAMIVERFLKLTNGKKYATGFSNGGALTYTLLCYRSGLFDGYSIAGWTLLGHLQRGDLFIDDGWEATNPNSLAETCGKSRYDHGHATGIEDPHLWGYGIQRISGPGYIGLAYRRSTELVAVFVGENDVFTPVEDIEASNAEIRLRNNLYTLAGYVNPYNDTDPNDSATTRRKTYSLHADITQPSSVYQEYFVQDSTGNAARHAMPDSDSAVCDDEVIGGGMTCDYDYTKETIQFFMDHAGLTYHTAIDIDIPDWGGLDFPN